MVTTTILISNNDVPVYIKFVFNTDAVSFKMWIVLSQKGCSDVHNFVICIVTLCKNKMCYLKLGSYFHIYCSS